MGNNAIQEGAHIAELQLLILNQQAEEPEKKGVTRQCLEIDSPNTNPLHTR
jgi:hypothetical protein